MNRPWMPLYVGDYLGDTGHLTTTQHGAYLLLMMHYWRKGELPDDNGQLAAITGLSRRNWLLERPTLQALFHSGWQHKRIDTEMANMDRKYRKRADAGSKGGTQAAINRWSNEALAKAQQNGSNAVAMHNQSQSHSKISSTVSVERGLGNGPVSAVTGLSRAELEESFARRKTTA